MPSNGYEFNTGVEGELMIIQPQHRVREVELAKVARDIVDTRSTGVITLPRDYKFWYFTGKECYTNGYIDHAERKYRY